MKKMMFFISHTPNPRFIKQINYLADNYDVCLVYFNRASMPDLNHHIKDSVEIHKLINLIDEEYVTRFFKYMICIKRARKILVKVKPDYLIINNIDILFLLLLSGLKKYKAIPIMEISDLRTYTYGNKFVHRLLRRIDLKFFNQYVEKLIVTSPKFYDFYYGNIFNGKHFVLENKPLSSVLPERFEKARNDKLVIGIVGRFIQGKTYETLFKTVGNNDSFEVHIHGSGKYQSLIEDNLNVYNNIKFFGEYNFFEDIGKIHSSIDIIYMVYDTTSGSKNNLLALPNKLYESMYFETPMIVSKQTYLGELVSKNKIGLVVDACDQADLINALDILTINLKKLRANIKALDKDLYLGDKDYQKFKDFIQN